MTGRFGKTGNTCWAQCRACAAWFPVTATLLNQKTIRLVCPECNAQFLPDEAQSLIGNN